MPKIKYPYQNLTLKNIKGEKWEDIPMLETYFQISNFGRVKRLEYEVTFKDGRVYTMKPLIIKPTLIRTPNYFVGDETYFLRTTLNLSGNTYNFSIARMVYYCFISQFDSDDNHILITCKNGDGRKIRLSNLKKVSMHDLRKQVINQKRCENILLRPDIREISKVALVKKRGKIVSQYNKDGKRVNTFHSISEATVATGLTRSNISGVLSSRKVSAGGFIWKYGSALKVNFEKDLLNRKSKYKNGLRKRIAQYDTNGEKIAIFNSINEASRKTNICSTRIGLVVNGKANRAGDFNWKEIKADKK